MALIMKTSSLLSVICILAAGMLSINANAQALAGTEKSGGSTRPAKNYSQDWTVLQKGDNLANVTVGILDFDYIPPFTAISYEKIVYEFNENLCLGVGGTIGLTGFSDSYGLGIYALGNLHITMIENLDVFTGLDLGKTIDISEFPGHGSILGALVKPVHIGASYFFSNKFAATVRLGGWGGLSLGIATKF